MTDGPRLAVDDEGVRSRHLLALPAGPDADDLGVLAASRFPAARWESAGRLTGLRALRLGRLSRLVGPYPLPDGGAVALGLPLTSTVAWTLDCPVERGDPPWPGGDRNGLKRAFPDGMPVREEERAVQWLVAAARRLGGSLRIGRTGSVLTPDPGALVDLALFSDRWLEPDEALATVRRAVRRARPSGSGSRWTGPVEAVDAQLRAHLARFGVRDERERSRLAAEAAAFDSWMQSHPQPEHGYGVEADLDLDGIVAVEVTGQDEVPLVLATQPWVRQGVVVYRVHWEPAELTDLEAERPSLAHRVARGRAAPQVRGVARVLQAVVGGAVLDEAEFPVDLSV